MFICYIDESGQPETSDNTSHYILAGLMVPIWKWKTCDKQIRDIKIQYSLRGKEIHTAWILRKYLEQSRIPNFNKLSRDDRIYEVTRLRNIELLKKQKLIIKNNFYNSRRIINKRMIIFT